MVIDRESTRAVPAGGATANGMTQQNGSVESAPEVHFQPQTVGREFVRQYYTLLHEAPNYLYRFYSNNSSFIHGGRSGDDAAVTGQTNIHQRIKELNFRDCRAKILHVDAQASVMDGVVIQVTGELSNNCEPMRRFIQTFLLVPLSSKNYYVHNDIFRYADEVYGEATPNGGADAHVVVGAANDAGQSLVGQTDVNIVSFSAASQPVVMPGPATAPLVASGTVPATNPAAAAAAAAASGPQPTDALHQHSAQSTPASATAKQAEVAQTVDKRPDAHSAVASVPKDAPTDAPVVAGGTHPAVPQAAPAQPNKHPHTANNRRGAQQQPTAAAAPAAATQPSEPPKPKTWAALAAKPAAEVSADATKPRVAAPAKPVQPAPQPTRPEVAANATEVEKSSPAESTWDMDSRQVFVGGIPATVDEQTLRENITSNYGVKVLGWRWIRETAEHAFACGILLLDTDEAATKLIQSPRPHVLNQNVNVNFEVKRDFRPRPAGRRFPPHFGPPATQNAPSGERSGPAQRGSRGFKRP